MKFVKKHFLLKLILFYVIMGICGIIIIFKIVCIQHIKGNYLQLLNNKLTTKYVTFNSERGSIYSSDGKILVSSILVYELRLDMKIIKKYNNNVSFYQNIDSLSFDLSKLFGDHSKEFYKKKIINAYINCDRFFLLKKNVMMNQLNELMNFDILKNCGKHNNGIIIIQNTNSRYYLYNNLAKRTLGYFVNETKPVGLEGAYNYYLKGESIKILMKNITNKVLIPINNFAINKYLIDIPKGNDIISSINISIQDMIHQIMLKSLISNDADWGTAILMEVNTGYIRAIVNLSKENENIYIEKYNYAIGFSCEPGSVFKLPSIMVGLEDNKFNIYDNVDSSNEIIFYGVKISNASKNNKINNLITAFAKSSNVAIAKIITDYYHKNPIQFINRLKSFGLNNKLENIDIPGSGKVFITSPSNKNWSNLSLPCMSYGYGISLTPLQILTFYNAIANNGNMVKPLFVTAIKNNLDKTIQNVEIESINNNIASNNTIKNAQVLLKSVIQNGTGKHLRSAKCAISGKTGTTIIFNQKHGYNNVKKQYRSSFCGYFPSDAPLYSITVMISNPKNGKYYSSDIVLPIIKEITDKIILKEMQYYIDIDTLPIISNNNFVK